MGLRGVFAQLRNSVSHFLDSSAAQLQADGNGFWSFTTGCLLSFKGCSSRCEWYLNERLDHEKYVQYKPCGVDTEEGSARVGEDAAS